MLSVVYNSTNLSHLRDICNAFNTYYSKVFDDCVHNPSNLVMDKCISNSKLNIVVDDVVSALKNVNVRKDPGPDNSCTVQYMLRVSYFDFLC